MTNPLISVVVPVYNAASTIEKCVVSIRNQSYRNLNIVLIDDGSADDSLNICRQLASSDSRIRVFHQENGGVSSARNHGIRKAHGRYICFIDSDDWVDPDYISILFSNMTRGGLSACNLTMYDGREDESWTKRMSVVQAQISVLACEGMEGFPVNKMFDLSLIKEKHIFFSEEITICEDVLFSIHYLRFCYGSVSYAGKRPYHYVKTDHGATNSRFTFYEKMDERKLSEARALEECRKYLLTSTELYKAWQVRYTKAAVNTLRTLAANERTTHPLYKILEHWVRNHLILYLISPYSAGSAKISVLISAFSPKFELYVWRHMNSR